MHITMEAEVPLTPITSAIMTLAMVSVVGLLIGSLKFRGIGLGSAGVLFAGIAFGHFGASIDENIGEFAKEFGLILFVFTIGLHLGPGIVQLWKKQGLLLNALAASIVGLGVALVVMFSFVMNFSVFESAGLFSGATTNTPSLGAAQQAAAGIDGSLGLSPEVIASAYAVAYPGGIVGIIASMLLLKRFLRVDVEQETERIRSEARRHHAPIERRCILIDNQHLAGYAFAEIPGLTETGVRISRIQRGNDDTVHAATEETKVYPGDIVQVVGTASGLDRFEPLIGVRSDVDLMVKGGDAQFRRIVVTDPAVLNRPLRELSLDHLYNATVTRIRRSGIEMTVTGSTRFYYGDIANIVGDAKSLDQVTTKLGNSVKSLDITHFFPIFLGIAAGVLLGMIPFHIPGVPFPIKFGLAGGPLAAAILFSLVGSVGRVVWYIPYSANLALRELGILLFLACVGLHAGETFFAVVMTASGIQWMLCGVVVTMFPLLLVGLIAHRWAKLNYLTICGVLSGSMTDPPALAFASSLADSDACSTAYAAVYPLTMILRIVAAQVIIYALA
ncbi:MAG: putative transporter [Pirellulaceae bacterium]